MEGYEVTLLYKSGKEDPTWVIPRNQNTETLCDEIDNAGIQRSPRGRPGFKGFLVKPLPSSHLSRGKFVYGPAMKNLQKKLLLTANPENVTENVKEKVVAIIEEQK